MAVELAEDIGGGRLGDRERAIPLAEHLVGQHGAANHNVVSGGQLQGLFDLLASAAAVAEARGQIAGVGACRTVTRIVLQGIEGQLGAPPVSVARFRFASFPAAGVAEVQQNDVVAGIEGERFR
jgi:hypothetical protein